MILARSDGEKYIEDRKATRFPVIVSTKGPFELGPEIEAISEENRDNGPPLRLATIDVILFQSDR